MPREIIVLDRVAFPSSFAASAVFSFVGECPKRILSEIFGLAGDHGCLYARERAWAVDPVRASARRPSPGIIDQGQAPYSMQMDG